MALEKFHYTIPAEKVAGSKPIDIALPKFNQIPFGIMRKLRKENDAEQLFGLLESLVDAKLMDEASLEALDTLGIEEVTDMMTAWQKDAGVSIPE